jgi:hypothetical protein
MQTQVTVADVAGRQVRCLSQSLDSAIFLTNPRINHGEISHERCPFNGVSANWRQLDCVFAFANRILLVPEEGINHTERAKRRRLVRLTVQFFGELLSRALKGRASSRLITMHPRSKTLTPAVREWNIFVKAFAGSHIR